MAKNLKINIKNSQLAEALKIDKLKKKPAEAKSKAEKTPLPEEEKGIPVAAVMPAAPEVVEPAKKEPVKTEMPPLEKEASAPAPVLKKEEEKKAPAEPIKKPASEKIVPEPRTSYPPRQETGRYPSAPYSRPDHGRPAYSGQHPRSSYPSSGSSYPPRENRGPYPHRTDQAGSTYSRPPYQGGQRPYPSSGYAPRPFTPRPPREGMAPSVPPKELPPKILEGGKREGVKDPLAHKKAFKTTVFDEETFTKKAPSHKDFKESALKKSKDSHKTFDSRDRQGLRDVEGEEWRKKRTFKPKQVIQEDITIRPKNLSVRLPISIKDLAAAMKLKASQLIAKLFMQGVILTINDFLDDETTIQLLGHEFDCEVTIDTSEEDRIKITDKTIREEISQADPALLKIRPPVVTFMGHVDHGKTSLIDAIRKSNIAAGEAGAITQHIGAFQCHTNVGTITVLDTPGHEAFSEMRSRGADVTDIVVLVIAGDEGMRAQTLEAMKQAEEAKVTIIVAINKCDKPTFNAENVYRQLADNNHLPEAWGGTTITVNCSATTKQGIPELLEMLALQAEVLELKANPQDRARGTVIESEMHKGLGAVATILVQNGTLRLGDAIVLGEHFARIKTMYDEHDAQLQEAGPSTPVKITGLSGLPIAGSEFVVVKNEKEARELSQKRSEGQRLMQHQAKRASIENMLQNKAEGVEKKVLPLILKADVQGSLEALKTSLLKIPSQKVELNIISAGVGEISESDIEFAAASKAAVIGFHTGVESHAESLIKENKVNVVIHDIIYHLVDEVKKLMLAQLDKIAEERDAGKAEVKAIFKSSQLGNIAGCSVIDGSIRRNQHLRVMRDGNVIWKGPIQSLKRVKEDVKEVSKGMECGILLNFQGVQQGDILQAFDIVYLEQEL